MWGANPNIWNFSSREAFCCEGVESMGVNEHGSASDNRRSSVAVLIILLVTGRVTLLSLEMLLLTWRSRRFYPLIRLLHFSCSPQCSQIKVIDYQGKPLKHKKVILVVSCGEQQFKQKYITGDSGTASFSLNTTTWNSTLASLEVSEEGSVLLAGVHMHISELFAAPQISPLFLLEGQ